MPQTVRLTVTGMTCGGCENAVGRVLRQASGVESVSASHRDNLVVVTFDPQQIGLEDLKVRIAGLGYEVESPS